MTTMTTQDSGARSVASVKMGNPSLVFGRCFISLAVAPDGRGHEGDTEWPPDPTVTPRGLSASQTSRLPRRSRLRPVRVSDHRKGVIHESRYDPADCFDPPPLGSLSKMGLQPELGLRPQWRLGVGVGDRPDPRGPGAHLRNLDPVCPLRLQRARHACLANPQRTRCEPWGGPSSR